jgi:hypothetical protein
MAAGEGSASTRLSSLPWTDDLHLGMHAVAGALVAVAAVCSAFYSWLVSHMGTSQQELKADIKAVERKLDVVEGKLGAVEGRLWAEIRAVEGKLWAEIRDVKSELKADTKEIKAGMQEIKDLLHRAPPPESKPQRAM